MDDDEARRGMEPSARDEEEAPPGLPPGFYARWDGASVDERLRLAREAAGLVGFDAEEAFVLGSRLETVLEDAGRFEDLEGVLDVWRERAPRVHDTEPAVATWRAELALRLPGRDVKGALVDLARRTGDCALVLRLAEWCLYRGRLAEASAGITEAWPRVREDESLAEWNRVDFVARGVLTCMDAELARAPDASWERMAGVLAPFDRAVPHWAPEALVLRTGRAVWRRRSVAELLALPSDAFFDVQRALVMAFEPELRLRQGWPWGRTQLVFPELFHLLPGPFGTASLLPLLEDLEQWVRGQTEERMLRPHAHAATALALRPWGEFLHGLGLIDAGMLAAWWEGTWELLGALPEQFASLGDRALGEDVRRLGRGRWPHGGR